MLGGAFIMCHLEIGENMQILSKHEPNFVAYYDSTKVNASWYQQVCLRIESGSVKIRQPI